MAWWEEDANMGIAHELLKRAGWTVYDLHQHGEHRHYMFDDDIIDPGYWSGVAEKNGFVLVVHRKTKYDMHRAYVTYKDGEAIWMPLYEAQRLAWVNADYGFAIGEPGKRRKSFEEVMAERGIPCDKVLSESFVPKSIQDKITKLEAMTVERGATEFEERTAKEKIKLLLDGCKSILNNIGDREDALKKYDELECPFPMHSPNPKGCTWHLEFGGVIYAKGKGIDDPVKLCDVLDNIVSNTFLESACLLITDNTMNTVSEDSIETRYSVYTVHEKDMNGQFVEGQLLYLKYYGEVTSPNDVYSIAEIDTVNRSLKLNTVRVDTYKPTSKSIKISFDLLTSYISDNRCYFVKLAEERVPYYFYDFVKEIKKRGVDKTNIPKKTNSSKEEFHNGIEKFVPNTIIILNDKQYYIESIDEIIGVLCVRKRIDYSTLVRKTGESESSFLKRFSKVWNKQLTQISIDYAKQNVTGIRDYKEELV